MSTALKAYVGAWYDYSNGVWTLTLRDREAGFLSAALLIFVGYVATQAWSVTKFVLHQLRVSNHARDGLWHQQQAAVRNSNGHLHALWLLVSLTAAWARQWGISRSIGRSVALVAISSASLLAWLAAQLFVSYVWTSTTDHFRIDNDVCGTLVAAGPEMSRISDQPQVWNIYYRDRLEEASTYARQCYAQTPDPQLCAEFSTPQLNWTSYAANCPTLDTGLCITTNSTPVGMNSGYINSNDHLGVNAKLEDTIEYRKSATCSPLQSNHATNSTGQLGPEYNWYYGYDFEDETQATFIYPLIYTMLIGDYKVITLSYDPAEATRDWKPNATMFDRQDASMSIFFLVTDYMRYFTPVYDTWFLTDDEPTSDPFIAQNGQQIPLYAPFLPVRILGCVEEHELCNPNLNGDQRCLRFTLATSLDTVSRKLQFSAQQNATAARMMLALSYTDLSSVAWMLNDPILAAKTTQDGTQYANLPNGQWQTEVGRWFSISLALMQAKFVEFVTGPADPSLRRWIVQMQDRDILENCRQQRVRNLAGYRNFDLTSVVIVVALGCAVILLGLSVDTIAGLAQDKLALGETHRAQWILDGVWQLQRLAYEGAGVRGWTATGSSVPRTADMIPRVDMTDKAHPRLRKAGEDMDGTELKPITTRSVNSSGTTPEPQV